ncbi:hypothetical protein SNE40_022687 [Patella caerulea]|uniref:Uncharacterized protein n=1 Tax=Patella caerulea TaxID=87958 RepID=A0AAN8IZU2_PATCE
MSCQVFEELPARTPADGCESIDSGEFMDVSFNDIPPYIKIEQISLDRQLKTEHDLRRRYLKRSMEIFRIKHASLKRKDSFLYRQHKQIKNRLHNFLNSAFCQENATVVPNGSCRDQQMSTPKQKSTSTQTRVRSLASSPGLLTIFKKGKKCTFC